jgi:hypothetical protein
MMTLLDDTPNFAALVPRITGSISFVSSVTLIFLIYRSHTKLSTIYHRIMFGMSVSDLMSSAAMALTTLPMPTNGADEYTWEEDHIGWIHQTKLGNEQTCQAQAFFFSSGIQIMFAYNGALCVYYACAIGFGMHEKDIKKKVEPFLHIVPLAIGLLPVIPAFVYDLYGPAPNEAWCTFNQSRTDGRKGISVRRIFDVGLLVVICNLFVVIFGSFAIIIWRVRKNGKCLAANVNVGENEDDSTTRHIDERIKAAHRNTKLILLQSAAYVSAFLLSLSFPLIRNLMWVEQKNSHSYMVAGKLMLVFMPLQGFFNFVIFLWHKGKCKVHVHVHNLHGASF